MNKTLYLYLIPFCLSFSCCLGRSANGSDSGTADEFNRSQLSSPVEWFFSGEERDGLRVKYAGQKTHSNILTLTAGNGFWDGSIRANNPSPPANENDKPFIRNDFEYLSNWTQKNQSVRWHIWCDNPGIVRAEVYLEVNASQAGSVLEASLVGENIPLKTIAVSAKNSFQQPWRIKFTIPEKGKYTLTLKALEITGRDIGKLRKVRLSGPAIKDASVLRARWRPAAVHGRLSSSKVNNSKMWVMQSKSGKGFTSYSPITTPFGYYGTSFDADGRTSTSMNFSMWSYGRGQKEPPIEQLAHLIALGSPKATFGGFGHEGTGVKLRGDWRPLASKPELLTQALRVVPGDPYDTYYGYFLDPDTNQWKFFAAGRKWRKTSRDAKKLNSPGSFVEVPGPPNRQRSGDVRREVFIRGWVVDENGQWHVLDTASKGADKNANKTWAFLEDGWYSKTMGGMEHFDHNNDRTLKIPTEKIPKKLPGFLSRENVRNLYRTPAVFEIKTVHVGPNQARIKVIAQDLGTNATAKLYYGENESLTFADRWRHSKNLPTLISGDMITLDNLAPSADYYCRLLVVNDQGKMWSLDTLKFTTKNK